MTDTVPTWAEALPEELRTHDVIKRTPDLPTAAKRLVDLAAFQGSAVALPKDGDADSLKTFEEKVGKFGFERTGGKPAKAEDYAVDVSGLPDAAKPVVEAQRKAYFDMGLPKKTAEALLARDAAAAKAQAEASQKALEGLKTKFGDALPTTMKNAEKVAEKFGFKDLLGTSLANTPGFYELMNKVGATMSEDTTQGGGGGGSGRTIEQVQADTLKAMEESTKMVEGTPERKAKEQEIQKLLAEAETIRGRAA